ncbi:MAG: DUF3575 domain-containing protein [Alistipes sp.]
MKRTLLTLICLATLWLPSSRCTAQIYAKVNGLYALVGVFNPAVEFKLTNHSTFQTELVYSPWQSVNLDGLSKPMHFGIFMNEYRYFFRGHNDGWYLGGNFGMMAFKMSKPYWDGGIHLEDRYSKGYGFLFGVCVGYEYVFRKRWILDAFFGWSYMTSFYNGYDLDGKIQMDPGHLVEPVHPDPFNGSSEWYPNKIGLSIGMRIFDPTLHKERKARRLLEKQRRATE